MSVGRPEGVAGRAPSAAERERLSASIADARAELSTTLDELQGVVERGLDWRAWVRERPLVCVAVACALGFRLGRGRWS